MLRQPQHHPLPQHRQVILLVSMLGHVAQRVSTGRIGELCEKLADYFEQTQPALCEEIDRTGQLSAQNRTLILDTAKAFVAREYS